MNRHTGSGEAGNLFFYILIAIVLIGCLTIALRDNGGMKGNIDSEDMAIKATQLIKHSGEVATAVQILLNNGVSESAIRFAHPKAHSNYGSITNNPQNQVFSQKGGGATYRTIPASMGGSSAPTWGFNGSRALPKIGSDKADLSMTAHPLNLAACNALNSQLGVTTMPSIACGGGTEFIGTFNASPTILNTTTFTKLPAPQFCALCTDLSAYVFFSTLLPR